MTIHNSIRYTREIKNLTQEDMAEKMNMSVSGYAKIERGEIQLKFDKLQQIAQIFNMEVVELIAMDLDKDIIIQFYHSNGEHATANYYANSNDKLTSEIEKLQLSLAHQIEIVEHKNREIENLNEIIRLMRK